jgi:predicted RNA-binding Zn-ribbon protein involved in translation (DUF1610 family)
MRSVRKALRDGELEKDTYDRLACSACGASLKTSDDPDVIGAIRTCPDCGREWQEIK